MALFPLLTVTPLIEDQLLSTRHRFGWISGCAPNRYQADIGSPGIYSALVFACCQSTPFMASGNSGEGAWL